MKSAKPDLLEELSILVRSRYGLIVIDTIEEERTATLLQLLADHLGLPFFIWDSDTGLQRTDLGKPVYQTINPSNALAHIVSGGFPAIYHFKGLLQYLDKPELQTRLINATQKLTSGNGALIVTGSSLELSETLRLHAAVVRLPSPGRTDYMDLLNQVYRDVSERTKVRYELPSHEYDRLIANLQGLTLCEAEKILTRAMIEDGKLCAKDIQLVIDAKKAIVEKEGLLEYYPVEHAMAEIADLAGLKAWIEKRKAIITDSDNARKFGLTFPKGILLLGVPGTGKTLCAKAVANEWGMPLLKMDPAKLYNQYIGESEKNFLRAMKTAEKMAPVVLLIDEIEKAFASGGAEDGGTSARILGSFLSWLQDRCGDVFVVATANDIEKLPPEFLRKGRFDEIFFVDLPDSDARRSLFTIHLKRRGHNPAKFNMNLLAAGTEGFSGAEIEQVIVSALYTCFSEKKALTGQSLSEEAGKTCPLSRARAESIRALREWAMDRAVPAN